MHLLVANLFPHNRLLNHLVLHIGDLSHHEALLLLTQLPKDALTLPLLVLDPLDRDLLFLNGDKLLESVQFLKLHLLLIV